MKSLVQTLTLAMLLSVVSIAFQVEAKDQPDTLSSETQAVENQTPVPRSRFSKACASYIVGLDAVQDARIQDNTEQIKAQTAAIMKDQGQPRTWSEIQERKVFDLLAAALSNPKPEAGLQEALALLSPIHSNMTKAVQTLLSSQAELADSDQYSDDRKEAYDRYKLIAEDFGRQYGVFSLAMHTLWSVKQGDGAEIDKPIAGLPAEVDLEGNPTVIYTLGKKSPARNTARLVWNQLMANARAVTGGAVPTMTDVDKIFKDNIFARLADVQQDLDQQKMADSKWVRVVGMFGDVWLSLTQNRGVKANSGFRRFMVSVTGLDYDRLMLYKYLGKIQEVVDLAVVINKKGNVIINPNTIDEAIAKLIEYNKGTAYRNDFLLTFARITEHGDVLDAIMKRVWEIDKKVGKYDKSYKILLSKLNKAKETAQDLDTIDTLDSHAFPEQTQMALVSIGGGSVSGGSVIGLMYKLASWTMHGMHEPSAAAATKLLQHTLKAAGHG